MTLSSGLFYRTRAGLKVQIVKVEPREAIGIVELRDRRITTIRFLPDGKFHPSIESAWDIVGTWPPPSHGKGRL